MQGKIIESPKAYLYRVAWNAALDIIRKRRRDRPDSEFFDQIIDESDALAEIEVAELVRSAIRRLPLQERRVLVLRDLCRFTVNQTAEILDLPAGTVGPTTTLAREHFRGYYSEELGDGFREEDD